MGAWTSPFHTLNYKENENEKLWCGVVRRPELFSGIFGGVGVGNEDSEVV